MAVRQALQNNPANLYHLILSLSHHLFTLLPSDLFPSTSSLTYTAQDTTKEALNCLRVLGRLLVVIYENDAERREAGMSAGQEQSFAERYLWNREPPPPVDVTREEGQGGGMGQADRHVDDRVDEAGQFEIGDDDEEEEAVNDEEDGDGDEEDEIDAGVRAFKATLGNPPAPSQSRPSDPGASDKIEDPLSQAAEEREKQDQGETTTPNLAQVPCLVDRLFSCTIDLLFCAGFTVPENVRGTDKSGEKINVSATLQYRRVGVATAPSTRLTPVCDLGEGRRKHRVHRVLCRARPEQDRSAS